MKSPGTKVPELETLSLVTVSTYVELIVIVFPVCDTVDEPVAAIVTSPVTKLPPTALLMLVMVMQL